MISDHIPSLIAIAICILLSGFFSAAETSFAALNRTRIRAMAESGNRKAALTAKLAENYDKLISTILIGNNIVNIAVASIGTVLFVAIYGDMGATISTVVVTVLVLIFGEITPKSLAKDQPEAFAMFAAPILALLIKLFTPLNFLFALWKRLISRLFRTKEEAKMSQEELLLLLEEVQQEGSLDEDEGELLRNAVEFGDLEAQDILTHRVELEGVSVEASKEEIAAMFTSSRFSRLLVYEGTIDKIVGIVHQKDFYHETGVTEAPLKEIMTPPLFIFRSEKVDNLLHTLQASKSHVAVVVDEYGGTLGIVTMEDILEELVGEIWDEHDEVEETVSLQEDGTYLVDCAISLDDFCQRFGVKHESDCVSLGGWVMEQMERIPEEGEEFSYENLIIRVTKTEDHRLDTVQVTILPEEE